MAPPLIPSNVRVTLGASTETTIDVPGTVAVLSIVPVTTSVNLQVSFKAKSANTAGEFFTLTNGQTYTVDAAAAGREISGLKVSLFATTSIAVDLVLWQ